MLFVVRSNDSFNFPLGLIKYIVIVIVTPFIKELLSLPEPNQFCRCCCLFFDVVVGCCCCCCCFVVVVVVCVCFGEVWLFFVVF